MTKAIETIARVLADKRVDESVTIETIADPYVDATDIESRHKAKVDRIEETYREVMAMNTHYGVVTLRADGMHVDYVARREAEAAGYHVDEIDRLGFHAAPLRVVFLIATGDFAPVKVEAMRAELQAVHSELGDASQAVFDLLEKEIALNARIVKLESRVAELKLTVERAKRDAGNLL